MSEEEAILKAMKEGGKPLRLGEITDLTGLDKSVVSKAMKKEGKVVGLNQFLGNLDMSLVSSNQ